MTACVESLGLAVVKGLSWSCPQEIRVLPQGVDGDRHWSPVTPDLRCIKATDHPTMVGITAGAEDLPTSQDLLFDGLPQTVTYYSRPAQAQIHGGALAERISAHAGRDLLLAHCPRPGQFLWSSPVSVVFRSELGTLPDDAGRYRANVVVDDRKRPIQAKPGLRMTMGDTVLEIERELERCVIINHHAGTGERDHSLLNRIRPGALLGYGCTVLNPGTLKVGQAVVPL